MADETFNRTFNGLQKWLRHLKYLSGVVIALSPSHPHLKHLQEHLKYSVDALIDEVPCHPVDEGSKSQAHDLQVILTQAKNIQKWAATSTSKKGSAAKKSNAAAAAAAAAAAGHAGQAGQADFGMH